MSRHTLGPWVWDGHTGAEGRQLGTRCVGGEQDAPRRIGWLRLLITNTVTRSMRNLTHYADGVKRAR